VACEVLSALAYSCPHVVSQPPVPGPEICVAPDLVEDTRPEGPQKQIPEAGVCFYIRVGPPRDSGGCVVGPPFSGRSGQCGR